MFPTTSSTSVLFCSVLFCSLQFFMSRLSAVEKRKVLWLWFGCFCASCLSCRAVRYRACPDVVGAGAGLGWLCYMPFVDERCGHVPSVFPCLLFKRGTVNLCRGFCWDFWGSGDPQLGKLPRSRPRATGTPVFYPSPQKFRNLHPVADGFE